MIKNIGFWGKIICFICLVLLISYIILVKTTPKINIKEEGIIIDFIGYEFDSQHVDKIIQITQQHSEKLGGSTGKSSVFQVEVLLLCDLNLCHLQFLSIDTQLVFEDKLPWQRRNYVAITEYIFNINTGKYKILTWQETYQNVVEFGVEWNKLDVNFEEMLQIAFNSQNKTLNDVQFFEMYVTFNSWEKIWHIVFYNTDDEKQKISELQITAENLIK